MPRGDRYHLEHYTEGPKRTRDPLNADVDILQDVADRVADLEKEADKAARTSPAVSEFQVCRAGVAKVTNIPNDGFRDPVITP